jgi:hypothetical protein
MLSVMIKTRDCDLLVTGTKIEFHDNPFIPDVGNVGGRLLIYKEYDQEAFYEYNDGTAYVMNESGKTIATYHLEASSAAKAEMAVMATSAA